MVVTFSAAEFRAKFPKFTTAIISDAELENAFDIACLIVDNTNSSVVPYDPDNGVVIRKTLLYLLVCHLATLALWPLGQNGPIASASQGSVSTSFSLPQGGTSGDWFKLTPCGQTFWQISAPFRMGLISGETRHFHPWG